MPRHPRPRPPGEAPAPPPAEAAAETVAATPPSPSQRSVATGPGLTVLTRIPSRPTSFDSDFEKFTTAAFAAL